MELVIIDVKRAFFYAQAKKDIFAQLPEEEQEPGMRGRLLKSTHGTRDAAGNLEDCYMDCAEKV